MSYGSPDWLWVFPFYGLVILPLVELPLAEAEILPNATDNERLRAVIYSGNVYLRRAQKRETGERAEICLHLPRQL